MSIFGSIMEKLGFGDDEKDVAAGQVNVAKEVEAAVEAEQEQSTEEVVATTVVVDIEAQLEALAAENGDFNWKESIVDLMKILGLDSSYGHRKELAKELKCPAEFMEDSAKMNVWLHKQVMIKLSENGGKVPTDLL